MTDQLHCPPDQSLCLASPQVSSGQQFEDSLTKQLAEKRAQVLELERELGSHRGEVATLKGRLVASEEVRRGFDGAQCTVQSHVVRFEGHMTTMCEPPWAWGRSHDILCVC